MSNGELGKQRMGQIVGNFGGNDRKVHGICSDEGTAGSAGASASTSAVVGGVEVPGMHSDSSHSIPSIVSTTYAEALHCGYTVFWSLFSLSAAFYGREQSGLLYLSNMPPPGLDILHIERTE
jgi:hypothetical protein